jgi:chromosome segregation ATPase
VADSEQAKPIRADIQAQIRALEEKRDALEERLAASRLAPISNPEAVGDVPDALHSILRMFDESFKALEQTLASAVTERDHLIVEIDEARRRSEHVVSSDAMRQLSFLSAIVDDLVSSRAQMNAAMDRIRRHLKPSRGTQGE